MTRILQLRSSSAILGAENVVLELCKKLPEMGFEPIIGVPVSLDNPRSPLSDAARDSGIDVKAFPISGPFDLRILSDIRKFVAENKIQIVHSHGYREDLYALACRRHAFLVATNHLWKKTTLRLKLYAWLDSYLLRNYPKVVAVSDAIAGEMRSRGIREDRISVIANGVDTDQLSALGNSNLRYEFGFSDEHIILCTISSLTSEKAIHSAISALAVARKTNNRLRLLVVGDGPELPDLQQQAVDLNITEEVVFAGRRSDVPAILASVDIFLLTSLIEGLPMALLEAMATGLPVIATSVGDVPKAVDNEVGSLIPPADEEALLNAISQISTSDKIRAKMGFCGQRRVAEQFSSQAMTRTYVDLYRQLITDNGAKH